MSLPEPNVAAQGAKKSGRLKKILLGLVALLVLVYFGAPLVIGRVAESSIASTFEEKYGAKTTMAECSFSWPGSISVRDLRAVDSAAKMDLKVAAIDVDVALIDALRGSYDATILLDRPDVMLRGGLPQAKKAPESDASKPLPETRAKLTVKGGRITLIDASDRKTVFEDVAFEARLESLDAPLDIVASLRDGANGTMKATAKVQAIRERRVDMDHISGPATIEFSSFSLDNLAAAANIWSPLSNLAGRLSGKSAIDLSSLLSASGTLDFALDGLAVAMPAIGDKPLRIEKLKLNGALGADRDGTGPQKLTVTADSFLDLTIDATATRLRSSDGKLDSKITAAIDLAGLSRAAPSLLRVKDGFRIGGQASLDADTKTTLGGAAGKSLGGVMTFKVARLEAFDASGSKLPIDPTLELSLDGEHTSGGKSVLRKLQLGMDSLSLRASGGFDVANSSVENAAIDLDSDLGALSNRFGSFLDLPAAFTGKIKATSRITGQGRTANVDGRIDLTKFTLSSETLAPIGPLDLAVVPKARLDLSPGATTSIDSLDVTSDIGTLGFRGQIKDLLGDDRSLGGKLTGKLAAGELSKRLAPLLAGYMPRSGDIVLDLDLAQAAEKRTVKGIVVATKLAVDLPRNEEHPEARRIAPEKVYVDIDAVQDATSGFLTLNDLNLRAGALEAALSGKLPKDGLAGADLRLSGNADIGRSLREFGPLFGASDASLQGVSRFNLSIKPTSDDLAVVGTIGLEKLASTAMGSTLANEKLDIDLDTLVNAKGNAIDFHTIGVRSTFLQGSLTGSASGLDATPTFKNIRGDFDYVPDKVGALIAPWFSGRLFGKEKQKLTLALDGSASSPHWIDVLRGSKGNGSVGLGNVAFMGLNTTGKLILDLDKQVLKTDSDLGMNGGALGLDGHLDLREQQDARSTFKIGLANGQANGEMSPLLQLLNPIFAATGQGTGSLVSGLIDANLELSYDAPLSKEQLEGGFASLPKTPINGKGRIALTNLGVGSVGLIGTLAQTLGIAKLDKLELAPVDFSILKGRLRYDQPLAMSLGGIPTTWTGTIGLDKTLDLKWNIPVTEQMVAKNSFLKFFQGTQLEIPLAGTTESPRLQVEQVFTNLASQAATKMIQDKAGNLVGDKISDVLGGKLPIGGEKKPTSSPTGQEERKKPEDLVNDALGGALGGLFGKSDEAKAKEVLQKADALWNDKKVDEARLQYKKIVDKYKSTKLYRDNAGRIEERSK